MHNGLVHRYIYMYELSMSVWLLLKHYNVMARVNYYLMRRCPFFVLAYSQQVEISLFSLSWLRNQAVFSLTPWYCVLPGKTPCTNCMPLGLVQPATEAMISALEVIMLTITPPRWLMSSETFIWIHVQKNNSLANTWYFSMYKIKPNKPFVIHFSFFARSKENDFS